MSNIGAKARSGHPGVAFCVVMILITVASSLFMTVLVDLGR